LIEEPVSRRRVSISDSSFPTSSQLKEPKAENKKKVVIEDLVLVDDHDIIIYTTVRPKTSTIFISSLG